MGTAGPLATSPYPIEALPRLDGTAREGRHRGHGPGRPRRDHRPYHRARRPLHRRRGRQARLPPSGHEPSIYLFSRSGFPYCAKSFRRRRPMGDYEPAICTTRGGGRPQAARRRGPSATLTPAASCCPLSSPRWSSATTSRPPVRLAGRGRPKACAQALVKAWESGTFEAARRRLAAEYGEFSAEAHLFAGKGRPLQQRPGLPGQGLLDRERRPERGPRGRRDQPHQGRPGDPCGRCATPYAWPSSSRA